MSSTATPDSSAVPKKRLTAAEELQIIKPLLPEGVKTSAIETLISRPRIGVGVLLFSPDETKVLIGERLGSHGANKWALPGGHLEGGEEWAVCAARETEEETGLLISPHERISFFHVTNDLMPTENLHYITIFVKATLTETETSLVVNTEPDKCAGWHWLTWEEIAEKSLFIPLSNLLKEKGINKKQ